MELFLIFPVHLFENIKFLKDKKCFLIEEKYYFDRSDEKIIFNILKPIYHRASMRNYFDYLKENNIDVSYVPFDKNWVEVFKNKKVSCFDPVDLAVNKKLNSLEDCTIYDTPAFLTSSDLFETINYKRMYDFYKWQRQRLNIYVEELGIDEFEELSENSGETNDTNDTIVVKKSHINDDIVSDPETKNGKKILKASVKKQADFKKRQTKKPTKGKWSMDEFNRKKFDSEEKESVSADNSRTKLKTNDYVKEAIKYAKSHFMHLRHEQFEKMDDITLLFPVTIYESKNALKIFIKDHLFKFGTYQDAILKSHDNNPMLHHSGLSVMLNVGLLTPKFVLDNVIAYYEKHKDKIEFNNVEGFIRQLVGWREYTRYIYETQYEKVVNHNYFDAKKKLNEKFYNGTTVFTPLNDCIKKAFKNGYLHHIERLMVVSNYMTLCNVHPKEVYRWFMEFALDSYDWVMVFNVYCMATFSDGGNFSTKPYISSSNYILKMSDYEKKETWAEIHSKLYWNFVEEKKDKLGKLKYQMRFILNKRTIK
jgi:deoxyribodipyrimidine photolyase-related protein